MNDALTAGRIYFASLWDESTGTTPEEVAAGRDLLQALAHARPITTGDDASWAALRRLVRYHVIVATESGYRVAVPLVARWVMEKAPPHRRLPDG